MREEFKKIETKIKTILNNYPDLFKDKIVFYHHNYTNNKPLTDNFYRYLVLQFEQLGIKELLTTIKVDDLFVLMKIYKEGKLLKRKLEVIKKSEIRYIKADTKIRDGRVMMRSVKK